jgi:hypothetical protein
MDVAVVTARAHVEYDLSLRGVRIHLAETQHDGTGYAARFADIEMERYDAPGAVVDDPAPLRLPEDHARALYEALARFFGGAPDMAVLRADFQHERTRVDRLIGFLDPRGGAS